MVDLVAWYAVLGVVQASLALWVILGQPRRLLNWAVGALLMLWAGSGIVFQVYRETAEAGLRLALNRVGDLYEASNALLILVIVDRLVLVPPRPRWWSGLVLAMAAALPVAWLGLATLEGEALTTTRVTVYGAGLAAQVTAVLMGAVAANDGKRSLLQRRQAALLGLAFALLLAHSGANAAQLLGRGILLEGATWPLGLLALAGLGAAAFAFARLPSPFRPAARTGIRLSLGFAALIGPFSYGAVAGVHVPGGRVIALSAFALVLAVAVLRYDLAAARTEERRRLQRVAAILLGLCIAAILGVAASALAGRDPLVLTLALAALMAPVALLASPLRRLPAWLTRLVVLDPSEPEALRERVRVYAATLQAARDREGRILPSTQPALAALRSRLGLSARDHDLLVAMGGDQRAGGIVAYRLALVGAFWKEPLNAARLRQLREEFGLTERDHALVVEHVRAGADTLSAGGLFLGRYHVRRRLGEGGLGEVWLAHDNRTGVDVVIKHLAAHDRRDGLAMQRARAEARTASILDHPNIVAVRGVEAVGDELYLVLEAMAGGSLAARLRERGPLPEAEAVRMGCDVLAALRDLHGKGFVHRDVKPSNILFDAAGTAKLGDFNVARELVSGETVGAGASGPVGTFAYMPLDQARGRKPRPGADLHALGATLYEAVAGRPYLDLTGLSHAEALTRIAQARPPSRVPNASPALAAAIARALAPSPQGGFADAAAMLRALAPLNAAGTPAGSARRR